MSFLQMWAGLAPGPGDQFRAYMNTLVSGVNVIIVAILFT